MATQRDVLNMQDHGADAALSFSDAGLPSTTHTDNCVVPAAKGILAALNAERPDAIVVEFGDGIMGHYGVDLLLKDRELMSYVAGHVLCANDLVGAWGGLQFLGALGLRWIAFPARPPTTARASITSRASSATPAANGRREATRLADLIEAKVFGGALARPEVA